VVLPQGLLIVAEKAVVDKSTPKLKAWLCH
jgi:hypothetical protein